MEPRVALPRSPSTLRPAAYRKLWLSWEMHGSGRGVDCGRLSRVQSSVPYPAPTLTQASVTSWRVGRGGQWGRRVVVVGSASLPMLLAAGFGLCGPGRREAVLESEAGRTGEAEGIYLISGVGGAVGGPGLHSRGNGKGGWPATSHLTWLVRERLFHSAPNLRIQSNSSGCRAHSFPTTSCSFLSVLLCLFWPGSRWGGLNQKAWGGHGVMFLEISVLRHSETGR